MGIDLSENFTLGVVVPVKEIDVHAIAKLQAYALLSTKVAFVAVGKVLDPPPSQLVNLKIEDRECSIYAAMNFGAMQCDARYLLFMGLDDLLIASNISPVLDYLQTEVRAGLVVLPVIVAARLVKQKVKPEQMIPFHHQGVLFKKSLLLAQGGYTEQYRLHSDLDLMFSLQSLHSIEAIEVPLVEFVKGGATTSGQHAILSMREISAIYRAHRVSRMSGAFIFIISLLAWYRIKWLVRKLATHLTPRSH